TGATAARGSSVDPTTLINWVRGVDNKEDENVNSSLVDCRASIHGDVLHSRPLVVNYGDATGIYAFYGANDGTFRAVKAGQDETATSTDGNEVWSFVAPEHYSTLGRLYNNTPLIKYLGQTAPRTPRNYYFDGNIGVFQSADLATTHIFLSMRRGGRFVYALDVSTPTAPKFLWKKSYTDTGFSELGYTWSEPKVIALKKTAGVACKASDSGLSTDATSSYIRALVFGAGYDPTSDDTTSGTYRPPATMGRGVFVLNAADGSLIKLLQAPANDYKSQSNSSRMYPIPSDVTLLDTDADGCTDRIYAGDTGAKLHRFDIGDPSSANWKAYTIATLGDSGNNGGSNDRKFLYPPEVVLSVIGGKQVAYVMGGTGDREQPSATAISDRFYMIRDTIEVGDAVATSTTTTNAIRESQLTEVTDFNAATTTIDSTVANAVTCTKNSAASTVTPCFFGWYLDYETGEKSVNAPLTVAGTTFFGTNKPKTVDPRSCEANL
ncbi:MAG: PilC/PilY family type IV pilus protein, partial [Actinomycetota bacterium]|nr:PilC/PilY family type IV pilus protein [Actinomycetota bacterium]